VSIPERFARFITAANARSRMAMLAFGNPYLLLEIPQIKTYALGWGTEEVSQTAMVRALAGEAPITGKLPISLPPYHKFGEGLNIGVQTQ
jgi:beta-N-acetylhexosaminidase